PPPPRMTPPPRYAQPVHGRATGRGVGIIDTVHLVEVARAVEALEGSASLAARDRAGVVAWFAAYLEWMTTHEDGQAEREAANNHGTCWVLQVAAFARLTGRRDLLDFARDRWKRVLVPGRVGGDGRFL